MKHRTGVPEHGNDKALWGFDAQYNAARYTCIMRWVQDDNFRYTAKFIVYSERGILIQLTFCECYQYTTVTESFSLVIS